MFNRTGKAVQEVTNGSQIPAVYSQFFDSAYLADDSSLVAVPVAATARTPSFGAATAATGNLTIKLASPGAVSVAGLSRQMPAGTVPVNDLPSVEQTVTVRYPDGKIEIRSVAVPAGGAATESFTYVPAHKPATSPVAAPHPPQRTEEREGFIRLLGGTFTMGSPSSEASRNSDETQRQVTVSAFSIGKYEVTQTEWTAVMGSNPSSCKGDRNPVENVSWYDALVYCNKLSLKEGRKPCYYIKGTINPARWGSVPTKRDAAWARGRLRLECQRLSASHGGGMRIRLPRRHGDSLQYGNVEDQYWECTLPGGRFAANAFGLYDTHGNVREWCWDWYGGYSGGGQSDPKGGSSGAFRVCRGGSWRNCGGDLHSANRYSYSPWIRSFIIVGLRIVSRP